MKGLLFIDRGKGRFESTFINLIHFIPAINHRSTLRVSLFVKRSNDRGFVEFIRWSEVCVINVYLVCGG